MAGVVSGFYVPYPGGVWLVAEPANWREMLQGQAPSTTAQGAAIRWASWWELVDAEVYTRDLSAGIKITGLRGGIFKFDFSGHPLALLEDKHGRYFPELMRATAERVKIMNVFVLCLHSAQIEVENKDVGSAWLTHESIFHYHSHGMSGVDPQQMTTSMQRAFTAGVLSVDVIDCAVNLFDDIMCHEYKNTTDLVALLNHAVTSHKSHNFELAVVSSWTVCEALQNQLWKMYYGGAIEGQWVKDPTVQLTKKRREKLEGRDFTASVVSEILALAGVLTPEMHSALDLARSRRNNWLHGGKAPGLSDSSKSLEIASEMVRVTLGLDIKVGTGIAATGI